MHHALPAVYWAADGRQTDPILVLTSLIFPTAILMADWFYKAGNDVIGPIKNSQLLELVRIGTVSNDTQVRKDDAQWVLAQAVGGLMEAAGRTEHKNLCPYCGAPVAPPPVRCGECRRDVTVVLTSGSETFRPPTSKTVAEVLNPHEKNISEKDETTGSHMYILVVAIVCALAMPLAIFLLYNYESQIILHVVGSLLGALLAIGGGAFFFAVRTNNRRQN